MENNSAYGMESVPSQKDLTLHEQAVEAHKSKEVRKYESLIEEFNDEQFKALVCDEFERAGISVTHLDGLIPFSEVGVQYESDGVLGHYWPGLTGRIALYAKSIEDSVRWVMYNQLCAEYEQLLQSHNKNPTHESYADLMVRAQHLNNMFNPQFDAQPLYAARKILTLGTLIHEEVHALSDGFFENFSSKGHEVSPMAVDRLGFRQTYRYAEATGSDSKHEERFTGLNEAFTQIIAVQMQKKYVAQFPLEGISSTEALALVELLSRSYTRERWVAEQLITLFSVIAEVPQEVVERSFFHAFLHREDVLPQELVAALIEDVPALGTEALRTLLLRLQVAIQEKAFNNGADIFRVFDEIIQLLPEAKQLQIKDSFAEIFRKYNPSLSLEEGSF